MVNKHALVYEDTHQLARSLSGKVELAYDNIKAIVPRRKLHRETGLEIYTTQGYSMDFEVVDKYTDAGFEKSAVGVQGEVVRLVLQYYLSRFHKIETLSDYYLTFDVLADRTAISQLPYSIFDEVLIAPDQIQDVLLREKL